ncbi:MAG: molybdenum cofactor guanylyltransferase [Planctomycetota bacterium]
MTTTVQINPLYVLAGGASRRFGSDKAVACVHGVPMIRSVIDHLRSDHQDITLVTGATKRYADIQLPVITDQPAGIGPIGGLNAALLDRLQQAGPGWLVIAACDLVRPSTLWLEALNRQATSRDRLAVAYRSDRWEPMLALYHTDLLSRVEHQIRLKQYSVQQLLMAANAVAVNLPEGLGSLPQANTPEALKAALRLGGAA